MKKTNKNNILSQVKSHTKIVATLIAGYGVGEIMGSIMKDYQPDAKGLKKLMIKLGAVALTGMVVKEVSKYIEGEIDDIFEFAESVKVEVGSEEDGEVEEVKDVSGATDEGVG